MVPQHVHRSSPRPAARWRRTILLALTVLAWFAIAGLGGPLFGRIDEVSSNEPTAYLPESAESTEVNALSRAFYASDEIPAVILIVADSGQLDLTSLDTLTGLEQVDGVGEVSPPIPSEDGAAAQIFVPVDSTADIAQVIDQLRSLLARELPVGVSSYVTGPAGLTADLVEAFGGIDGLLLGVALIAVFVILVVVYRSVFLPFIVLVTSMFALCAALFVVWWMAHAGVFLLNGQTQGILFILVIGAATDYSLLYVSRYREALMSSTDSWAATTRAWRSTIEPIGASGGTVIAGLLCLLLSDLKSNSVLGPVAAIGIVCAMLAALTLLPAALALSGRSAFWPRQPRFDPHHDDAVHTHESGVWGWTVRWVTKHARPIWVVTTVGLLVCAGAATMLRADGVAQSELVLGSSQARDGQIALAKHFPGGSGSPAIVVAPNERLDDVVVLLADTPGIDSIAVMTADSPSGQAPISPEGVTAVGPPGTQAPEPTVVDGKVLLQVTLSDPADSDAALATIKNIRAGLHSAVPGALVGGTTATTLDTMTASIHDRNLIMPTVLVVIVVILMALLRAIVAPILLMITTILSFAAAMGVSAVVFNNILHFPGADPAVPLYSFVFLVALGIDYNIFLMTRVREEAVTHGTREGIIRGLAVTGTVITSAGVVLAATFAALGVIPILFLVQLAFIVAFGVLLDTFVVRTLLVPALGLSIGRALWWPSRLSRR